MTCIVGYVDKTNKKIYMGCDSCGSNGYTKNTYNNTKIFKNGQFLIGYTTSFRMGQLLEYSWTPPNRNDSAYKDLPLNKFMVAHVAPSILKLFEESKFSKISSNEAIGGTFLIGIEDTLFSFQCDFSVLECFSGFDSVGSGENFALGAMEQYIKSADTVIPEEMLESALMIASKYAIGVEGPFHLVSLDEDYNYEVIK